MRAINVLLLGALFSVSAEAGSVLKVDLKDSSGKIMPSEVYYAQDGMMRIDSLDSQGNVSGIDLVRDGVIWRVDLRDRTFTRIDQASVKQFFGAKSSQFDAMLAQLPPEKRAVMQARLAQMQHSAETTEYTYSDTGRSGRTGQYACHVWEERRAEHAHAEYCVVPAASLPAGGELEAAMKKALATTTQLLSGVPMLAKQAERFNWLGRVNGFPVSWHFVSLSGTAESEHILSSAEARSLAADKFAIPKGFTEKPLGGSENN